MTLELIGGVTGAGMRIFSATNVMRIWEHFYTAALRHNIKISIDVNHRTIDVDCNFMITLNNANYNVGLKLLY